MATQHQGGGGLAIRAGLVLQQVCCMDNLLPTHFGEGLSGGVVVVLLLESLSPRTLFGS